MRIDWQRCINDLVHAGFTCETQARLMGFRDQERKTVAMKLRRFSRGEQRGDMEFGLGIQLLDMHLDHCADRHASLTQLSPTPRHVHQRGARTAPLFA